MSNELPHALLQCSDCGTSFRVTLKKGRVPSKPIPCPKCKSPITVGEADILHPGAKTAGEKLGSELRQTKPGDDLRKTKLVTVNEGVASMMDPATSEIDPPTAEVEVDADEVELLAKSPPAFGIVQRKKIRGRAQRDSSPTRPTADSLGVEIVKGQGRGKRDNVFGERTTNSVAIGRISTRQLRALDAPGVNPDDPDLPMSAPVAEAKAEQPAPAPPKKLDLSRLRRVMERLESESIVEEDETDFSNPLDSFDLNLEYNEMVSEASNAIDEELFAGASSSAADLESEPTFEAESDPEVVDAVKPASTLRETSGPAVVVAEMDQMVDEAGGWTAGDGPGVDVEISDGYELGAADVPAGVLEPTANRGNGGVIAGVIVLLIVAAVAYYLFT